MFDIVKNKELEHIYYMTKNSGYDKELKIDLSINKDLARDIFEAVINKYKIIENNKIDKDVLNCKIQFIEKKTYYLIAIADEKNLLPHEENCNENFKRQK